MSLRSISMQGKQAIGAAKSTCNTLHEFISGESALIITTIGQRLLYYSIWLTLFDYGFNPLLYTVGYITAIMQILLGQRLLYCSLWLNVFGFGFNPLLFTVGYISALSHIVLGGLIKHKRMRLKIWWFFILITTIMAFASSIGIVYYYVDGSVKLLIDLCSIYVVSVLGSHVCKFFYS